MNSNSLVRTPLLTTFESPCEHIPSFQLFQHAK